MKSFIRSTYIAGKRKTYFETEACFQLFSCGPLTLTVS